MSNSNNAAGLGPEVLDIAVRNFLTMHEHRYKSRLVQGGGQGMGPNRHNMC